MRSTHLDTGPLCERCRVPIPRITLAAQRDVALVSSEGQKLSHNAPVAENG
jgi:hypothetical protein